MNSIPTPVNIIAFRDFLRARFPEAHAPQMLDEQPVVKGVSCIESLDLRKGAITEVVASRPGSGAALLMAGLLQREGACRELTALVDGSDTFDPWSLCPAALERMLWVRCREPGKAIRASDLLLRDGNIPLVILDLQSHAARALQGLPSSVWHRLRMLAERSGTCLCAFTPVRTVGCARTRVVVQQRWELMDQYRERTALLTALPMRTDRQRARVFVPETLQATA
jgi:hypothetical protein